MRFYHITYFIVLNILLSCNDNNDKPKPVQDQVEEIFELQNFPLNEGNTWVYKRLNLNDSTIDTVSVLISNISNLSNDSVLIETQFNTKNDLDSGYFVKYDSVLTFNNNSNSSNFAYLDFKLMFPLDSGNKWIGFKIFDTVKVVDSYQLESFNQISLPQKKNFDISSEYQIPSSSAGYNMSLSPTVGITYMIYSYFNPPIYLRYEMSLIDYNVNI